LSVLQTLSWANPPNAEPCMETTNIDATRIHTTTGIILIRSDRTL